jgi:hypothetical protein
MVLVLHLMNGTLIWLYTDLGWLINVLITDETTLYQVINTLHGGDNPTTFARKQLILASLSTEAVKPYHFLTLCFVLFGSHPTMHRSYGSYCKGRAQWVPRTADV